MNGGGFDKIDCTNGQDNNAEGRNCELDRDHRTADEDEDDECSLNAFAGSGTAAMIQQQVKQAAYHTDCWRSTGRTDAGGVGVVADTSTKMFASSTIDETTTSLHFDSTTTTIRGGSSSSSTPAVGMLLQQLHLPDPMNAVLQGPAETFRHFVRGWTTTDVAAAGAAAATAAVPLSQQQASSTSSSWILPPVTLRHSVSTPAVYHDCSLVTMRGEDTSIPPPIPLDPFQRSTSTPSAFMDCSSSTRSTTSSQGSAFYALSTQQFLRHDSYQQEHRSSPNAFGPVHFYSLALLEHTSIEVAQHQQHQSTCFSANSSGNHNKRSARKFLSEVRVLRRRRNNPSPITNNSVNEVVTVVTTGSEVAGDESSNTVITERCSGAVGAAAAVNGMPCCYDMIGDGKGCAQAKEQLNPNPLLLGRPPRSTHGRASPLTTTATSIAEAPTMTRVRSLSRRRSHSHSPQSLTRRMNAGELSAAFATLTTISETDREVMELNMNNDQQQQQQRQRRQTGSSSSSGVASPWRSSHLSSNNHSASSGVPQYDVASPREGASLPADRFFIYNRSTATTATRSSSVSVQSRSSTTTSSGSSTKDYPSLPTFVSYADDDDDHDEPSPGGSRGLLEEQREESPIILDDAPSATTASEVGAPLYVPPRSCYHYWRIVPPSEVDRESAAIASATEQLLPSDDGGEVQRMT